MARARNTRALGTVVSPTRELQWRACGRWRRDLRLHRSCLVRLAHLLDWSRASLPVSFGAGIVIIWDRNRSALGHPIAGAQSPASCGSRSRCACGPLWPEPPLHDPASTWRCRERLPAGHGSAGADWIRHRAEPKLSPLASRMMFWCLSWPTRRCRYGNGRRRVRLHR
jgi:hypothetical protein